MRPASPEGWPGLDIPNRQSARLKSLSERAPWEDEVLREVYAVRDAYAAEHNYDLERIYRDLKNRERDSDSDASSQGKKLIRGFRFSNRMPVRR